MNFDQKAVKFLANFYMNGGQHWTHGVLCCALSILSLGQEEVIWELSSPTHAPPIYRKVGIYEAFKTQFHLLCLGLERRPPILIDMGIPGPTQYPAPDVSIRESSPHPHYSISCKTPTRDGGGRRAWQTAWFQSESPFTQKADFLREKQTSNTTGETGPSPNTYNVIPGFQLKGPRSPAFSMSRAQALNSWISPAHTPGPAAYYVEDSYNSRFPSTPGVLIQGERRPKRHETGPFCTL
uniref:Sperm-tail PG-rich repeat containing 3 n=1 Tax=Vombatus ursinus TaxID=29139 RepID=A0A4X2KFW5_VOMUR